MRSHQELTFGERMADRMKNVFATWAALSAILAGMVLWIGTGGFGYDRAPFILLNLCLSCIAALQCFILLIAAKRSDQIAAELAHHDYLTNAQALALLRHIVATQGVTEEQVEQILAAVSAE